MYTENKTTFLMITENTITKNGNLNKNIKDIQILKRRLVKQDPKGLLFLTKERTSLKLNLKKGGKGKIKLFLISTYI